MILTTPERLSIIGVMKRIYTGHTHALAQPTWQERDRGDHFVVRTSDVRLWLRR